MNNLIHIPTILRLNNTSDKIIYENILKDKSTQVHNEIYSQLKELIKCQNPSMKIEERDYDQYILKHLNGRNIELYGAWIYYPWNQKLVHILDEEEFIKVRTNRNQYKITNLEQQKLTNKKIGIVGLSVGQSIALTIIIERICGEIRLADFDTLELSNLNRLRTPLYNMGLKKTVIAAREISEIDPFIKIKVFNDGLKNENLDSFFLEGGKLDLFIEVCDGLDIKIDSRYKARELEIPVVMDTNDRGMLDVERFDLEPDRPILHGLAEGLTPNNIKGLSNEDKIPYILKMVGINTISTRLKASMMEVEQSINTWPQLASSVTLGGALTTDVCRRILLGQYHDSGRYYLDMEAIVKDKKLQNLNNPEVESFLPPPELDLEELISNINSHNYPQSYNNCIDLDEETVTKIVESGIIAPSGGNSQPWKFIYNDKKLLIFHDAHFSHSLLDFENLGSHVGIGACLENIYIKAKTLGFDTEFDYLPLENDKKLIAIASFIETNDHSSLYQNLEKGMSIRLTNREKGSKERLSTEFYKNLKSSIKSFKDVQLHIIEDEQLMEYIGQLLASIEMIRIIHPRGHYDTFKNELRWTSEEVVEKRDGLDVNTLGASKSELIALKIAEDDEAIAFLREIEGGNAFTKAVKKSVFNSAALGIITMSNYSQENFIIGGRAVERVWIEANLNNISFQPISQLVFMLARLNEGKGEGFDELTSNKLRNIEKSFYKALPNLRDNQLIFIFRLCKANNIEHKSLRRPIESSFKYV